MRRDLLLHWWKRFRDGAGKRGVPEKAALKIFKKFNGEYMFPESHAFAFGVTAYQSAWLKRYYPVEFYLGLFNQQPMGFYSLESLKEDARKHGIRILNPDINKSMEKCVIEGEDIRLGFLSVKSIGNVSARSIVKARERKNLFSCIADFMEGTGLLQEEFENLADAGAFDSINSDRRQTRWEMGLRYMPGKPGRRKETGYQTPLSLPVEQDMVALPQPSEWDRMMGEYRTMGLYPEGHMMAELRAFLDEEVLTSEDVLLMEEGADVTVAGLVIRRQRPLSKAVFITLEDEFGQIPCMVFPKVYARYRSELGAPLILARGTISRREGTLNVMITSAQILRSVEAAPKSKDWG
jgi:error-prone DNA polymerase